MKRSMFIEISAAVPLGAALAANFKGYSLSRTFATASTVGPDTTMILHGIGGIGSDFVGATIAFSSGYGDQLFNFRVVSAKPLPNGDLEVGVVEA